MAKNPGGRPPKYTSVKKMQKDIDAYFDECIENEEPFTITGLALALDMTRESLVNYQNKDEFFSTIKRAKLRCQNYAEKHLFTGKNATGAIFNLKNNYDWKDKTEQDVNQTVELGKKAAQFLERVTNKTGVLWKK